MHKQACMFTNSNKKANKQEEMQAYYCVINIIVFTNS